MNYDAFINEFYHSIAKRESYDWLQLRCIDSPAYIFCCKVGQSSNLAKNPCKKEPVFYFMRKTDSGYDATQGNAVTNMAISE